MKQLTITFLGVLIYSLSYSQSVTFDWAKVLGGNGSPKITDLSFDNHNNIISTGSFLRTFKITDDTTSFELTSNGYRDGFVMKQNHNGEVIWIKQIGGEFQDEIKSVTVDHHGFIYVAGEFSDNVNLNTDTNALDYYNSVGLSDIFILKLDSLGNTIWFRQIGGKNYERIYDIAIDPSNNLLITGTFTDTTDFNLFGAPIIFSSKGKTDIFIQKLNPVGNHVWTRTLGGTDADVSSSIAIDNQGNIITTGHFTGLCDFDADPIITSNASSNGLQDVFIHKMDSNGLNKFHMSFGSTNGDYGEAITTDEIGNIYTIGRYSKSFTIGTYPYDYEFTGFSNAYLLKIDTNGYTYFGKQINTQNDIYSNSIVLDSLNNMYISGYFYDEITQDSGLTYYNLQSTGVTNGYVEQFNSDGNLMWAKQFKGPSFIRTSSLLTDNEGNVFISGDYSETVDLDPGINQQIVDSEYGSHGFIVSLKSCTPTPSITHQDITYCNPFTWIDGVKYKSGGIYTTIFSNSTSCDSIVRLNVDIHHLNTSLIHTDDSAIVRFPIDTLTYKWLDCSDSSIISTSSSLIFTTDNTKSVALIVGDGICEDTTDCFYVFPMNSTERVNPNEFSIYPIPNSGEFSVKAIQSNPNTVIYIYDLNGQKLQEHTLNDTETLIQSELPTGIYIIEITDGEKSLYRSTISII